jgi:hypothetical protein
MPNHVIEATTREGYTYQLNKHIMPWFGPMRMNEIMASHVREWVTHLQAKGVSAATIQKVRFVKIAAHIKDANLGPDDLIFAMALQDSLAARLRAVPDLTALGFTKPNAAGRRYRHGTMSGYNAGRCRCTFCKDAAAVYRAQRRAAGKDSPRRPRTVDTDGHIPRDWLRLKVWKPALQRAGSRSPHAPMTCATRTRHGRSPAVPTCRRSKIDSATAPSPPRKSTCTPSPRPTTWPWMRSARSATAHMEEQREPPHPPYRVVRDRHDRDRRQRQRAGPQALRPQEAPRGGRGYASEVRPPPMAERGRRLWRQPREEPPIGAGMRCHRTQPSQRNLVGMGSGPVSSPRVDRGVTTCR